MRIVKIASLYNNGWMIFTEGRSFTTPNLGDINILQIYLDTHLMKARAGNRELIMDMDSLEEVTDVASHMSRKSEELRLQREREDAEHEQARLNRDEQAARQQARLERRQTINQRFNDLNHFILTGFIAANGKISAQIPADQVKEFEKEYREIKGVNPEPHSFDIAKPESKWYKQYRIHIPKGVVSGAMEAIMNRMGLNPKSTSSNIDINDTYYVKKLLEMGFDFGTPTPSDVDKVEDYIRNNYGEDEGDAFIEGYSH